jgi:hypothetical protein
MQLRVIVLAAVLTVTATSTAAAKPPAPAAPAVGVVPAAVARGAHVAVPVTVRGPLNGARLTLALSRDARRGRDDTALGAGRRIKTLRRGRRAVLRVGVTMPKTVRLGTWRLLACLTVAHRPAVCRAARRRITVTAPASPAHPAPGPAAPAPASGPEPGAVAPFPRPAAPLDVGVHLQGDRAVTQDVGTAGGTIEATAADGTVTTLVIPAGALPGPVDITLTPLSALDGLPFSGGLAGGVQMAPDGLQLLRPARLTIAPASPPAGAVRLPFGYARAGESLHLLPEGDDGIEIDHFSGAGLASGTAEDRAAQRARVPEGAQAQREQESVFDAGAAMAHAVFLSIEPRLVAGAADPDLAVAAVTDALQAEPLLLAHADDPLAAADEARLRQEVLAALLAAAQKSFDACVRQGSVDDARRLLMLAFLAQRAGVGLPDADERVRHCLRFELSADMTFTDRSENLPDATARHVVTGLVVVGEPAGLGVRFLAQKMPDSVSFTYSHTDDAGCTTSAAGSDAIGPFVVQDIGLRTVPGLPAAAASLDVWVAFSLSREKLAFTGPGDCSAPPVPIGFHDAAAGGAYLDVLEPGHGFRLSGWTLSGSPFTASKVVDRDVDYGAGTTHEHSVFQLRHVPLTY